MAVDPVCGREVHPKQSQWLLSHRHVIYHFCSGACARRFRDFPDEFVLQEDAHKLLLFETPASPAQRDEDLVRSR